MWAQIIQAPVKDKAKLRKQWEEAREKLTPGSIGFLGATGGITTDGEFVLVARFESEEKARQNQNRPEQDAWWKETEKALGKAKFQESSDVQVIRPGSDDAGFVQMIQSKIKDRAKFEKLDAEMPIDEFSKYRPDVIGELRTWLPGNTLHSVIYFTSEKEARAGEKKEAELPPEVKKGMEEWMSCFDSPKYFDINEPWLSSPS